MFTFYKRSENIRDKNLLMRAVHTENNDGRNIIYH